MWKRKPASDTTENGVEIAKNIGYLILTVPEMKIFGSHINTHIGTDRFVPELRMVLELEMITKGQWILRNLTLEASYYPFFPPFLVSNYFEQLPWQTKLRISSLVELSDCSVNILTYNRRSQDET